MRDSLAGEVDRTLALEGARPARDVNAADDVPCSTWFCPRNHLQPLTPEAIAAGPSGNRAAAAAADRQGQGSRRRARVPGRRRRRAQVSAQARSRRPRRPGDGRRDGRHARVPRRRLQRPVQLRRRSRPRRSAARSAGDVSASTRSRSGRSPSTSVVARLAGAARTADGRLHGVAVSWLPGKILGAFDMQGRRADDPNDRIRHEDRRSLRASFLLVAWLAIFDASAINTLDSYVEEDGRHFVRHYIIDFGAGIGSATNDVKGPHEGGQHVVEVGRTMASVLSLGLYRRPYQSQRDVWTELVAAHPSVGWFPAETVRRRRVPDQPQGARPRSHDRPGRLLGRQAGDVVLRRADRGRRRRRAARTGRGRVPRARAARPPRPDRAALPDRGDRGRGARRGRRRGRRRHARLLRRPRHRARVRAGGARPLPSSASPTRPAAGWAT